jgi:hypothetical protein
MHAKQAIPRAAAMDEQEAFISPAMAVLPGDDAHLRDERRDRRVDNERHRRSFASEDAGAGQRAGVDPLIA